MASRWLPISRDSHVFRIHTDTTDYFRVEYGDVVLLGDRPYLIRHNAKEGRFGLDDEVKFWVKRAIDLNSGSPKIIKLVFYEKFMAHIGGIAFECYRSPRKEARILDLVAQMNAVDTERVEPMSHPLESALRLREDVITESDRREAYQAVAPATENGLYLVPKVIE